jgi:hypothetical protein
MRSDLYDQDFLLWTEREAGLLRAAAGRSNEPLDWDNLAEEVESLGRSQVSELHRRLGRIVEHLLKLQFSPASEPRRGWGETVFQQRDDVQRLLEVSPTLRPRVPEILPGIGERTARLVASILENYREFSAAEAVRAHGGRFAVEQVLTAPIAQFCREAEAADGGPGQARP